MSPLSDFLCAVRSLYPGEVSRVREAFVRQNDGEARERPADSVPVPLIFTCFCGWTCETRAGLLEHYATKCAMAKGK
jgi:hypothetical protein